MPQVVDGSIRICPRLRPVRFGRPAVQKTGIICIARVIICPVSVDIIHVDGAIHAERKGVGNHVLFVVVTVTPFLGHHVIQTGGKVFFPVIHGNVCQGIGPVVLVRLTGVGVDVAVACRQTTVPQTVGHDNCKCLLTLAAFICVPPWSRSEIAAV